MEDKNISMTNEKALQAALIQQTLKSWRFFLLFSVPPMMWGLFSATSVLSGICIVILCGIVWTGCWRLWLDEGYFKLIHGENNECAGKVLHDIWHRSRLRQLTLTERQQGGLHLVWQTMLQTAVLWISWLILWWSDYISI